MCLFLPVLFAHSVCFRIHRDLSRWNVSSVRNLSYFANRAEQFSSDLSAWNVSRVGNFYSAFRQTQSFDSDLSGWDVSRATDMVKETLWISVFKAVFCSFLSQLSLV